MNSLYSNYTPPTILLPSTASTTSTIVNKLFYNQLKMDMSAHSVLPSKNSLLATMIVCTTITANTCHKKFTCHPDLK